MEGEALRKQPAGTLALDQYSESLVQKFSVLKHLPGPPVREPIDHHLDGTCGTEWFLSISGLGVVTDGPG